jgi:hypothetical protein
MVAIGLSIGNKLEHFAGMELTRLKREFNQYDSLPDLINVTVEN